MKRYRWFRIGLPNSYQSLVRRVRNKPIDVGASFGFAPIVNDKSSDRFRYLRRSKVPVTVLDDAGNAGQSFVETIDATDFEMFQSEGKTWLRVEDPPRSLRDFLNSLEMVAGMGFSAVGVKFPYRRLRVLLAHADVSRMVGFKGLGSDATLRAVARIEVASKEGIDPAQLPFLKGLKYSVDHATFDVVYRMIRGQVSFTESGLVRITGQLEPYLLNCIERHLEDAIPVGS
jgi:hypothetical protein